MSHFTVLVIGDNPEGQLAPYHEFECTGSNDEYIQDIDKTKEALELFEKETTRRFIDPDGVSHNPYDERFYREPTAEESKKIGHGIGVSDDIHFSSREWSDGKGYRAKVHFLPEGWTDTDVPTKTVESFAEWCEDYYGIKPIQEGETPDLEDTHKYGYCVVGKDGNVIKLVDRTNPNSKWDWYSLGGRWTGFFKLKKATKGVTGRPGLFAKPAGEGYVDQCTVNAIDFEGMRDEAGTKAGELYDKVMSVIGDKIADFIPWKDLLAKVDAKEIDIKKARDIYHGQKANKAIQKSEDKELVWVEIDEFLCTRDEYVKRARDRAIATFAVIKDGKWYERGDMGWWGCVANEKEQHVWNEEFNRLIDELDPTTLVSVYDCHI